MAPSVITPTNPARPTPPVAGVDEEDSDAAKAARKGGQDRIDTALKVFAAGNFTGNAVILAVSTGFADATAAIPFSHAISAPILLTNGVTLEQPVLDAIKAKNKTQVYVMGNASAISDSVVNSLSAAGLSVERIGGVNRYETAVKIAEKTIGVVGEDGINRVYVATGLVFPDAIAVGAVAAQTGGVVVFSAGETLESFSRQFLTKAISRGDQLVSAGGPAARAIAVDGRFGTYKAISYTGADRYATAALLAGALPASRSAVLINGSRFADSLTGGALAANQGSVVLLTRVNELPEETQRILKSRITSLMAVGGVSVITPHTLNQAVEMLAK